ncbi:MAG: BsuBI/PstI family type II restriction endonuclease [Beijerinckiaceae bacterium]|nr:BsuBI/PstI family type II restriction endonuclease [Beijerinckiaceae bacterium]
MRELPSHQDCVERLELIFPRAAFDSVFSNPLAGWAVLAMLYCDAVVSADGELTGDETWARPSMLLWFSDETLAHRTAAERMAWLRAATRGSTSQRAVRVLLESWEEPFSPKYSDNSRETLRDETFAGWLDDGAVRKRPGVKTTSGVPRWALTDAFADLFEPSLTGQALLDAIDVFRNKHMTPGGKARAVAARQRGDQQHAVIVTLPNGVQRTLEPGEASIILKGVIEQWAPAQLADPVVVSVSEPGDKTYTDAQMVQSLGISINASTLLPDAIIADIAAPGETLFWIIEAVATDGEISERRKEKLLMWAAEQRIPAHACRFLSAFSSRNAGPAKRRLKDLAVGTYAWYADEPTRVLTWDEIQTFT